MNMQVTEQSAAGREGVGARRVQYSTFYVANRLYGVDVTRVQEVVKPMQITKIPLAEKFVQGLINLRGQVVTAVVFMNYSGSKSLPEMS